MRYIFLVIFCFNIFCLQSQSFNYHRYTVKDGLPSSQIYDLHQDHDGFIWIASDKGVSKFDGSSFTNFGTADGLPYTPVFKVYEDPFGRIWFISIMGQLSYREKGKIIQYKYNHLLQKIAGPMNQIICSFSVAEDSSITIGTVTKGAYRVNDQGKIVEISKNGPGDDYAVLQIKGDQALCYTMRNNASYDPRPPSHQLNVFDGGRLKYTMISHFYDTKNTFALIRKNGHIIYATHGQLLDYYNGTGILYDDLPIDVISLYEDSDSCLWIGDYKGGVRKFPPNASFTDGNGRQYFPQKQISKVMEDYEHGFWFATLHDGLLYVPSVKINSLVLDNNLYNEERTVALETDHRSRIFVGTNKSVLYVFSGGNLKDTMVIPDRNSNTGIIKTIFYDTAYSNLYVSTYNITWQIDDLGKRNRIWTSAISYCLGENKMLYAGYYHAVMKDFPKSIDRAICYKKGYMRPDALYYYNNALWIGSPIGMFVYRNDKLTPYENVQERIQCLATVKNKLYAGTVDGRLLEINPHNDKVKSISLCKGSIYHIEPVNDTLMGISSSCGALFYNIKKEQTLFRLTELNGLSGSEVIQMKLLANTMYVLTYEGVDYIELRHLKGNTTPPRVHILSCQVDSLNYIGQNNPQFSYSNNFITFNFVGLSFRSLGKVQYLYRLKGYSDQWKSIAVNSVQFPFLPPGNYVFEIKAINEDGVESTHPARFSFTILTPFWRTAWFIGVCILLIIGVMGMIFMLRYRRLKERNNMLLQINDLRQKSMSLQMNPHFVFNSLNSIQSFVLSEDSYKATKYLSRFAKLIRMGLHHANTNLVSLEEEITLLNLYLGLEQMRFKNNFTFSINIEEGVQPQEILIPPMLIQPLVENSVKHGIDLKNESNYISVRFFKEGHLLKCRVEDNGIGINTGLKSKQLQEVEVHQSMGMSITTQRIRLFCEKEGYPFSFEVKDKSDLDNGHSGTIIIFTIPYSLHDQSVYNR